MECDTPVTSLIKTFRHAKDRVDNYQIRAYPHTLSYSILIDFLIKTKIPVLRAPSVILGLSTERVGGWGGENKEGGDMGRGKHEVSADFGHIH